MNEVDTVVFQGSEREKYTMGPILFSSPRHINGSCQQGGQAKDIELNLSNPRNQLVYKIHTQIDYFESRTFQHHNDQVLADIVDISLDGTHDNRPF
jgi:hypothetical protein